MGILMILGGSARAAEENQHRVERSLLGQNGDHGHHHSGDEHNHHHDHADEHNHNHEEHNHESPTLSFSLEDINAAQGEESPPSFDDVSGADPGSDGKRCIEKVDIIEETEYDDVVQCDHSYDKRCHTTFETTYEAQQEEECDENYRKTCFIEYEQIAFNETVAVCRPPLVKDCDVQGPEICRTEYESECWTKQEVHDGEDETSGYTTNTKCSKWL